MRPFRRMMPTSITTSLLAAGQFRYANSRGTDGANVGSGMSLTKPPVLSKAVSDQGANAADVPPPRQLPPWLVKRENYLNAQVAVLQLQTKPPEEVDITFVVYGLGLLVREKYDDHKEIAREAARKMVEQMLSCCDDAYYQQLRGSELQRMAQGLVMIGMQVPKSLRNELLRKERPPQEDPVQNDIAKRDIFGRRFGLKVVQEDLVEDFTFVDLHFQPLKLVVEIDGGVHREGHSDYGRKKKRDELKQNLLEEKGYTVLRVADVHRPGPRVYSKELADEIELVVCDWLKVEKTKPAQAAGDSLEERTGPPRNGPGRR